MLSFQSLISSPFLFCNANQTNTMPVVLKFKVHFSSDEALFCEGGNLCEVLTFFLDECLCFRQINIFFRTFNFFPFSLN